MSPERLAEIRAGMESRLRNVRNGNWCGLALQDLLTALDEAIRERDEARESVKDPERYQLTFVCADGGVPQDFGLAVDGDEVDIPLDTAGLSEWLGRVRQQLDPESIQHWDSMRRERDQALAYETEVEWQEASGLLVGGDPGGVTPEHLRAYVMESSRLLVEVSRRDNACEAIGGDWLIRAIEHLLGEVDEYAGRFPIPVDKEPG